jgi:hypothetical protein
MNFRYIVISSNGIYGSYGVGDNLEEARKSWKKGGGKKSGYVYRELEFSSEHPFAPRDRKHTDDEADAYVDHLGYVCTIRCDRKTLLEKYPGKKKGA